MNWKVLHEPYPFDNSKKRTITTAIAFGAFVFMFLYFFQPFGLSNYNSDKKTLQLFGYGLVTTFCLLSNYILFSTLFKKWYNKQSWTVLKNIQYTIWVFFTIGSGNLLYSVSQQFLPFSWDGFLFYQGCNCWSISCGDDFFFAWLKCPWKPNHEYRASNGKTNPPSSTGVSCYPTRFGHRCWPHDPPFSMGPSCYPSWRKYRLHEGLSGPRRFQSAHAERCCVGPVFPFF